MLLLLFLDGFDAWTRSRLPKRQGVQIQIEALECVFLIGFSSSLPFFFVIVRYIMMIHACIHLCYVSFLRKFDPSNVRGGCRLRGPPTSAAPARLLGIGGLVTMKTGEELRISGPLGGRSALTEAKMIEIRINAFATGLFFHPPNVGDTQT